MSQSILISTVALSVCIEIINLFDYHHRRPASISARPSTETPKKFIVRLHWRFTAVAYAMMRLNYLHDYAGMRMLSVLVALMMRRSLFNRHRSRSRGRKIFPSFYQRFERTTE